MTNLSDPPNESGQSISSWVLPEVGQGKRRPQAQVQDVSVEQLKMPTAEEIEAIRQAAREEGLTEGHEEGYALGRREGLEGARKEIDERLHSLDQIIAALDKPLADLDEEVEPSLVSLAIAVARQLVRREIKTDPSQVVGVVREALSALPLNSRNVRIHLHPDDAVLVADAYSQRGSESEWQIEKDPSLARGGCRVLSDISLVDATVESRLTSIIAPLLNEERLVEAETPPTELDKSTEQPDG